MRVGVYAGLVDRCEFACERCAHVSGHDVPVVVMVFVTVFAQEEDSINAARFKGFFKTLDQFEVFSDVLTFSLGEGRGLFVVFDKRRRIIGIVGERIAGHLPIKVHLSHPIAPQAYGATVV